MEEVRLAVVQQFPGQAEQERGGFLGGPHLGLGRTLFERDIHVDGETATSVLASLLPRLHHLFPVSHGHRGIVQKSPPLHEILLDLASAVLEIVARPDGVFLQIPTEFLGFDGTDGCGETPALRADDFALARRGRIIDQPGASGGAADAVLLVKLQVAQFEDEFLKRLSLGLWSGLEVSRTPLS